MPGGGAGGAPFPVGLPAAAGGSDFGSPVSCNRFTYTGTELAVMIHHCAAALVSGVSSEHVRMGVSSACW